MREFCKKYCKGYQETRKCFADGECKEYKKHKNNDLERRNTDFESR